MPHFPVDGESSGATDPTSAIKIPIHETEAARKARLQIKTRRRRYLELHPEYFESPNLELADPLLYDRMIRRFQTTAEREAEGRKKGYSGVLEADIMRSEAKVDALAHPDPNSPLTYRRDAEGSIIAVEQDEEDRPNNKEEGEDKWREVMEQRFLRGEDNDFEYADVDESEEYNDHEEERRNREEKYFDEEEEEFIGEGEKTGETGVQDY